MVVDEARRSPTVVERDELPRRAPDRLSELERPPDALPLPERHRAGDARGRRDEHPVSRDLLDPPGGGAEQERLALSRLVHHLLVELADSTPTPGHPSPTLDEEDSEQAPVGDRSGVRDRETAHALPAAHEATGPIPDDARPQLGELLRRITAGEHVEHVLELCP